MICHAIFASKISHDELCLRRNRSNLPTPGKFEFTTFFHRWWGEEETAGVVSNAKMVPFCTPFWTEVKRWLVRCSGESGGCFDEMCTLPIFTDYNNYLSGRKMQRPFNFRNKNQYSTALEALDESHLYPYSIAVGYEVSKFSSDRRNDCGTF
jgi:hypothetical protein